MAVMLAVEETRMVTKTIGKKKVTVGKEGMILALEQEKAHERVRWGLVVRCVEVHGSSGWDDHHHSSFVTKHSSRISINKHISPALKLECGVLQRDPLSVLLYILNIQPLL
jgi:hypothetical protein